MAMRDAQTDWHGLCRICDLADTDRCRSCPTRTRAFGMAARAWHQRHRIKIAYVAVMLTAAASMQVAR